MELAPVVIKFSSEDKFLHLRLAFAETNILDVYPNACVKITQAYSHHTLEISFSCLEDLVQFTLSQ
jgi:hypothetical protein